MITVSDLILLPYTRDLTEGGIAYALRSLPYTYDRMGGSPYDRLRHIVAGVAHFHRRISMNLIPKAGLALVAAAFALTAQAQELTGTLKKIKETGAITIGHRESSIPFSYLDDKQQPIGYAMDLCMKVVVAV